MHYKIKQRLEVGKILIRPGSFLFEPQEEKKTTWLVLQKMAASVQHGAAAAGTSPQLSCLLCPNALVALLEFGLFWQPGELSWLMEVMGIEVMENFQG